jgi:hypothetical protein
VFDPFDLADIQVCYGGRSFGKAAAYTAFRKQLGPVIDHARKPGREQQRQAARTAARRDRSGAIRPTARKQGWPVSERGRIPAGIGEQYEAATERR